MVLVLVILVNIGFVMASTLWEKNPVERVDLAEESIFNANRTGLDGMEGFDGYLRSLEGQRVHVEFFMNTNSCASCHFTHIAPGEKLLFQRSIYNTCTTCHFNATMNTYNVLTGETPGGALTGGGRFYDGEFVTDQRKGTSYHLSTGLKTIGDAPGARYTRRDPVTEIPGAWDVPFTCGSCHGPHGTYNGRHLSVNPNNWLATQEARTESLVPVPDDPGAYTIQDTTLLPWYYAEESPYAVSVLTSGGQDVTERFSVNHLAGIVRILEPEDSTVPDRVVFYLTMDVGLEVQNQFELTENVLYRGGTVGFCTSCHVAYLDTDETSRFAWHDNFYHAVDMDISGKVPYDTSAKTALRLEWVGDEARLTCLTCHFAHGTDVDVMQRRGENWDTEGELWGLGLHGYTGPDPQNTVTLRYFDPDNGDGYAGRFESCFLCHGEFLYQPLVVETSPGSNEATAAEAVYQIDVLFNITIDEDSLPDTVFTVLDSLGSPVEGSLALVEPKRLRFSLSGSLLQGEKYTVTLSGVKAVIGGTMEEYSFSFYTAVEVLAHEPTGPDPVPRNTAIAATLSGDIDAASVDQETFRVTYLGADIPGTRTVERVGNDTVITFVADDPEGLPQDAQIVVTLVAPVDSNPGIRAVSGAPLKEEFQWSFWTEADDP
jgi:predicted CXXCH cytochrome family protein